MAKQTNIVLEQLRHIRDDLRDLKDHADRSDIRLANMEQTLGQLYTMAGSDRANVDALHRRVERIERRLELRDDA